ncbi:MULTISPECIES: mannitol dehydrogenase family protein [unclassified Paraburkholderia]|uniref:mannitol dehydrogenase family protein n=1 Tax=unclassified Paraburkholderia TaxID=2615204 RepID=UPI001619B0F3|nr:MULTISPECIES: mannitol dehydrogenase family protein [unclassified Paraburkholderia]MBB5412790.1 fructuronate reductase [Paraburkholderia sp. HC6.4b]MBB5454855.1 fructuronate reductase [Paraburkholderia sp. Kb1A]
MRLSNAVVASLAPRAAGEVVVPAYDRTSLAPGIVHLGLGAFHRAHQAVYTEHTLRAGDQRWGIVGVSLRRADTSEALTAQDHLYTVNVRNGDADSFQVVGALIASLVAPQSPAAVLDAMSDPRCHIVSLTITEKGYCRNPASGALQFDHPEIVHDLREAAAPRSAIGFVVRALALRRAAGLGPFTVLSCDNLPSNGGTMRALTLAFAREADPVLADWIEREGAFPNTMVDRIVPLTTDADRMHVAKQLGADDAWPVMTEPFSQWVIEDRFAGPRPAWERAGATLVGDARPYEQAKLRMLNGAHSALAYLGSLIGYDTVDQAIAAPAVRNFVENMLRDEVEPTLSRPALASYRAELFTRFRNTALDHRLQQIATDGSQKLPQRWLESVRANLKSGAPTERLAFVLAGWIAYLSGQDETGRTYAIADPLADTLAEAVRSTLHADAIDAVQTLFEIESIFGCDLRAQPRFVTQVARHLAAIRAQGVVKAMGACTASRPCT